MSYPIQHTRSQSTWDIDLIRSFDRQGPRYTYYPAENRYSVGFTPQHYIDLAESQRFDISPLSVYVNVPFCHSTCYFCSCQTVVARKAPLVRRYLDAIAREMQLRSGLHSHRPVTRLHLGGGTPSYLKEAELTELMHYIASNFRLSTGEQREYSIDIDPQTVKASTIALLKGLGFNHIHIGLPNLGAPGADSPPQLIARLGDLVASIRDHQFKSLSLELLYGLPQQSLASLTKAIDQLLQLAPDRIALFNYTHLPQRRGNQWPMNLDRVADAESRLAILEFAGLRLLEAGYEHIGMEHFVRPGDELAVARNNDRLRRSFQGYSNHLAVDLVGLGPSAISQIQDGYCRNADTLDQWAESLEAGSLPIASGLIATKEDKLRKHVIMSLACQLRLDIAATERNHGIVFTEHFQTSLKKLQPFVQQGLVVVTQQSINVTSRGQLLLRNICMCFDQYVPSTNLAPPERHS